MRKQADVKEFEGIGGRYTVSRAFGGIVSFDDGSVLVVLTVTDHAGRKLIHPLGPETSKAADVMRRFASCVRGEKAEGLTDFEEKVLRAAMDFSLTVEEREDYHNPDDEDFFMDLPDE